MNFGITSKKVVKMQIEQARRTTRPFYRKVLLLASAIIIAGALSTSAQNTPVKPTNNSMMENMKNRLEKEYKLIDAGYRLAPMSQNQNPKMQPLEQQEAYHPRVSVSFDQSGYAIYEFSPASEKIIDKYSHLTQNSKDIFDKVYNIISSQLGQKDDPNLVFMFTRKFARAAVMLDGAEFFNDPNGWLSKRWAELESMGREGPQADTLKFVICKLQYYYFKSLQYRTSSEEFESLKRDLNDALNESTFIFIPGMNDRRRLDPKVENGTRKLNPKAEPYIRAWPSTTEFQKHPGSVGAGVSIRIW